MHGSCLEIVIASRGDKVDPPVVRASFYNQQEIENTVPRLYCPGPR